VDYRAYFFPVKYVITQNAVTVLKKYTPYAGILMGQPDYANIETVNRISVTNATWTVDRDGYINVGVRRQNSTLMNEWINLYIDEKLVYSDFDRTNNTQSPDRYSNVLPVSKGDVIRIEAGPGTAAETLIYCYYIPPKAVPNLFVEGADLQTSSDIGKVNINPDDKTMTVNGEIGTGTNGIQYLINRPDLWANGVEIDFGNGLYGMRRAGTIPGTIAAGTVDTQVLLTVSDYTAFVLRNYGGSWDSGDGCLHAMIGLTNTTSFTSSWSSIWFVHTLTPAQLQLRTQAGAVRTNSPYDVWITYKK
jgi:hypothetical protein